ncbi:cell wall-binding repeat-containing protein [Bacillus sp. ISL-55]|uniref:cell wall-binding repeat-containing protein n=1 Tax=Bacillus sp. ISL-55 TaxID=2819134 RepID=UPI001BE9CC22|nr:cell wall-binding repeat-containing protein [Bacillus sp. ISL-55]
MQKKIASILFLMVLWILLATNVTAQENNVLRIQGKNRYDTAIEISKSTFPEGTDTVVLVTGTDFPDALSGAPLAFMYNAPILTTTQGKLIDQTANEIKRLGAEKAIILGGTSAISTEVVNGLKALGLQVERIAGKNRYETSALIADRIPSDTAILANGQNFPDALATAPYAAKNSYPILLTRSDKLPLEIHRQMRAMTIIAGGQQAVNDSILKPFPETIRISGKNRYETNLRIVHYFDKDIQTAYIATGNHFADALTGSILASVHGEPIVLVNTDIPLSAQLFFKKLNTQYFNILGGQNAIGPMAEKALLELQSKTFFSLENPLNFSDLNSEINDAGILYPDVIFSGEDSEEDIVVPYGNSKIKIDNSMAISNMDFEQIFMVKNLENNPGNTDITILLDKEDVNIFDRSLNTPLVTLKKGQRLPISAETNDSFIINIGGFNGYIRKQDVSLDNGIPILMYHHILKDEENKIFRNVSTTITDLEFESQMKYLFDNEYIPVTLGTLESYLDKRSNLPSNAVVITFDDGLKSVYKYAFPVLNQYDFRASEFMITSKIYDSPQEFHPDGLQYISLPEMNEMKEVFEFHSHTDDLHQYNTEKKSYLVIQPESFVEADLLLSKSKLDSSYFAYPFGQYNENTISLLRKLEYRMAFTTKLGKVKIGDDKFQLNRIAILPGMTLSTFASKIKN